MGLFNRSLGSYIQDVKIGLGLLLLVGFIRFLMKPVFGIPYDQGTHFTGMFWLLLILVILYSVRLARLKEGFLDVLGTAVALAIPVALVSVVAIAIDEFGGIDTYFTDPAHGGDLSPWVHMSGHIIAGVVLSLGMWGIGSLVFFALGGRKKK